MYKFTCLLSLLIGLLTSCNTPITEKSSSTGVYYRDFDWIKMQGVSPIKDKDSLRQFNTLVYIEYDSVQQIKQAKFSINHYGERVLNRLDDGAWLTDLFRHSDASSFCDVLSEQAWLTKRQYTMFVCNKIKLSEGFENNVMKAYWKDDSLTMETFYANNAQLGCQQQRNNLDEFLANKRTKRIVKYSKDSAQHIVMRTVDNYDKIANPELTSPPRLYRVDTITMTDTMTDLSVYYLFLLRAIVPCD